MDNRIIELKKWGCDIKSAMERMLDDEDFYIECVSTILDEPDFENLKNAISSNEVEKAFDYAHSLKGVLANLGLTPMFDKTVEIVEPLRVGNADGLLPKADELIQMREHLKQIFA